MAKKIERIVAHPRFYMMVEGKMQHVPKGTVVSVTEADAKAKGKKFADPATVQRLDGGKLGDGAAAAPSEDVLAALAEMQNQVDAANARADKAEKAVAKAKPSK